MERFLFFFYTFFSIIRFLVVTILPFKFTKKINISEDSNLRIRYYSVKKQAYPIILIHGLTIQGYNDKRLIRFSENLALSGFNVITPDISNLKKLSLNNHDILNITDICNKISDEYTNYGIIGFSIGATYSLISSAFVNIQPEFIVSIGAYFSLNNIIDFSFSKQSNIYNRLCFSFHYIELLDLNEQEVERYKYIMNNYCEIESKFNDDDKSLINKISELILKSDIKEMIKKRISEKRIPEISDITNLHQIRSRIYLIHIKNDNLIPFSESLKIYSYLKNKDLNIYANFKYKGKHVEIININNPGLIKILTEIIEFSYKYKKG